MKNDITTILNNISTDLKSKNVTEISESALSKLATAGKLGIGGAGIYAIGDALHTSPGELVASPIEKTVDDVVDDANELKSDFFDLMGDHKEAIAAALAAGAGALYLRKKLKGNK